MRYFMRTSVNDKITLLLFSVCLLTIGFMSYAFKTGQFETHKSWVYSVDTNNQGTVVSASENELLLWNERECTDRLMGHSDAIKSVVFSHSGQQIASGSIDKSINVWLTVSKKIIKTLNGHEKGVNKVKFSNSDNYIISAGYDNRMLIWNWKNNEIVKELAIKHTNFSINSQDVVAYIDSSCYLTLFALESMSVTKVVGPYCGSPIFSPQNDVIAVNDVNGSSFIFIDIKSNKVLSTLNIQNENSACNVSTFIFTPDGKYIVAGVWGGDLQIWDWKQKKRLKTLSGHNLSSVEDLSFNSKNQLISASGDRSLKFWDWYSGDLKMVVGDGSFQKKLNGFLSISVILTLVAGFWALAKSTENKLSSYILLSIISFWTLGIGLGLYFFKSALIKYAKPVIWTATILSGLFFWSIWFSWLVLFTIPFALLFCYIIMTTNKDKRKVYLPLMINLVFCGILCSIMTPEEIWR